MKQIELKILKLLLTRDFYNKYGNSVSKKIFPSEIKGLIKCINYLHEKKEEEQDLTTDELYHFYESSETITVARLDLVKEILKNIDKIKSISPDVAVEVVAKVHEKEAARSIADKALSIVQRDSEALTLDELKQYVSEIDTDKADQAIELCATDIKTIKENKNKKGIFKFTNGLEQLQSVVPTFSIGNNIIVFASTNAGKSSFVAQAGVGLLEQGHKILYFGNEEPAEDIILNFVRSSEQATEEEVLTKECKSWDAIKDNFYMVAAHGMDITTLENAIKAVKPNIVIYDQLDYVTSNASKDTKKHDSLEMLYQKVRSWGEQYKVLNIILSQANDEATGKMVLRNNMMANSRIGKSGSADLVLGIGMKSVDNPQRSICFCKNKITGKHEVIYMVLNAEKCRYEK